MSAMTPREAAELVETVVDRWSPDQRRALRVLIDYARATADPGDLAREALVEALRNAQVMDYHGIGGHDLVSPTKREAERIADVALRSHRCAPPAPEIVTGEQAAELPVGSVINYVVNSWGAPVPDSPALRWHTRTGWINLAGEGQLLHDECRYAVLYRAPDPAPVIAVGDTVTTAAELDRLPVGAVVRWTSFLATENVSEKLADGWAHTRTKTAERPKLPARVLDLGGES